MGSAGKMGRRVHFRIAIRSFDGFSAAGQSGLALRCQQFYQGASSGGRDQDTENGVHLRRFL